MVKHSWKDHGTGGVVLPCWLPIIVEASRLPPAKLQRKEVIWENLWLGWFSCLDYWLPIAGPLVKRTNGFLMTTSIRALSTPQSEPWIAQVPSLPLKMLVVETLRSSSYINQDYQWSHHGWRLKRIHSMSGVLKPRWAFRIVILLTLWKGMLEESFQDIYTC